MMSRVSVTSDEFSSVGYDMEDQTMEVTFRDGRVMLFEGVSMDVYDDFVRASDRADTSMSAFYREHITPRYAGKQVKDPREA